MHVPAAPCLAMHRRLQYAFWSGYQQKTRKHSPSAAAVQTVLCQTHPLLVHCTGWHSVLGMFAAGLLTITQ